MQYQYFKAVDTFIGCFPLNEHLGNAYAVLRRVFSTVGDTISTVVKDVKNSGGIPSVLGTMFNTVREYR